MSQLQTYKSFLIPKLRRVGEFMSAQGVTMAGNLLYGLLCVRLLPVAGYAKFVVVFGVLGSLGLLLNVGISNTLVPLVSEQIDDRQLIADYVASLRTVAHWLFAIVSPVLILVFPFLVRRQQWDWQVVAAMEAMILVAAWFARVGSAYGAVLLLRRDRKAWYRGQMISSLGTLALLLIFWVSGQLNEYVAILLNIAGIIYVGASYYVRSGKLLGVVGISTQEKRQAIVHLALPNSPSTIYYAIQGQIALMLITYFGHAKVVASVGALTRLSQIFTIFGQMSPVLIEPYFARLPRARLKRNYIGTIAALGSMCLCLIGLALYFPGIFLWVLGPKYSSLRFEVFLVIASGSISYVNGVMWVIHSSRRFVYWWNNMLTIATTVSVQAIYLWKFDLSTVRAVLLFNISSAASFFFVCIICGIYGFTRGPRQLHRVQGAIQEG
jgi:O-antigen/teichoic acid export membrane protein